MKKLLTILLLTSLSSRCMQKVSESHTYELQDCSAEWAKKVQDANKDVDDFTCAKPLEVATSLDAINLLLDKKADPTKCEQSILSNCIKIFFAKVQKQESENNDWHDLLSSTLQTMKRLLESGESIHKYAVQTNDYGIQLIADSRNHLLYLAAKVKAPKELKEKVLSFLIEAGFDPSQRAKMMENSPEYNDRQPTVLELLTKEKNPFLDYIEEQWELYLKTNRDV